MTTSLSRVSTGKVFYDTFSDTNLSDRWTTVGPLIPAPVNTRPQFVWQPVHTPLLPYTADIKGTQREGMPILNADGTWTLIAACYGANPAGPIAWQPFSFTSSNRGLTWTDHGPLIPALANGSPYYTTDIGLCAYFSTDGYNYISVVESRTNAVVPGTPYYNADYRSTDPAGQASPYTLYGSDLNPALGANGTHTSAELVRSSVVYNPGNSTWEGWFSCADSGGPASTIYNVDRITASDPRGPWSNTATNLLLNANVNNCYTSNIGACENPIFLGGSTTTPVTYGGRYMIVGNILKNSAQSSLGLWTATPASGSDAYANFNDASIPQSIDFTTPGITGVQGGGYTFSTICPFRNTSNGIVTMPDGGIPVVWSSSNTSDGSGSSQQIYGGKLEAAFTELNFTDTTGTDSWLLRPGPAAGQSFIYEFAIDVQNLNSSTLQVGAVYCVANPAGTDSAQTCYMSLFTSINTTSPFTSWFNITSGSFGFIANQALPTRPIAPTPQCSYLTRVKIAYNAANGNRTITIDDIQQDSYTPSSIPSGLGTQIGFRLGGGPFGVINPTCYLSPSLTINNLPAGANAILRMGGFVVDAQEATSTGTVTLTAPHWPCDSIEINGVDITPSDGDPHWWGGDVLTYVSSGAGGGYASA